MLAFQLAMQASRGPGDGVVRVMQRPNAPGGLHAEFPVDINVSLVRDAQLAAATDPGNHHPYTAVFGLSHLVYYPIHHLMEQILRADGPWVMPVGPVLYTCPYHRDCVSMWLDIQVLAAQASSCHFADMLPFAAVYAPEHLAWDVDTDPFTRPPHAVRRWAVKAPYVQPKPDVPVVGGASGWDVTGPGWG